MPGSVLPPCAGERMASPLPLALTAKPPLSLEKLLAAPLPFRPEVSTCGALAVAATAVLTPTLPEKAAVTAMVLPEASRTLSGPPPMVLPVTEGVPETENVPSTATPPPETVAVFFVILPPLRRKMPSASM